MDQNDLEDLFERENTPDASPSTVPMPGTPVQEVIVMGEDDEGDIQMEDDEIINILEMHIRSAVNWWGSEIAIQQAEAMEFYLGLPIGKLSPPGVPGRSSYVDTSVSDQIEWMMPALMEKFFASPNMIQCDPRKPGDEMGAKQMTASLNHIIREQNPGFAVFQDWFKNALLNKVGVAKVFWEETENVKKEFYDNLTDDQLAILQQDPEIQIVKITSYVDPAAEQQAMAQFRAAQKAVNDWKQAEQQARMQGLPFPPPAQPQPGSPPPQPGQPQPVMQPPPPPQPINLKKLPQLHNVVCKVVDKAGKVAFDAMNGEDFLIASDSRRVEDGFSAHRVQRTISYLRQRGYDKVEHIDLENLTSQQDAETANYGGLAQARQSMQNTYTAPNAQDDYGDDSMRQVWLYECYLPIDCDLDGIAEWRKITLAGGVILENVMVDGPPFATLCPCPIPGLFYGRSIADLAIPTAFGKTGLVRSLIDNVNVQVNGRTWAIESQVNISDLLTNRPGSVVRVKSANAVGALQQGLADSQGAYQLLQFLDDAGQERSGVTKYTQGMDADTLNHTATGIENITSRADMRTQLVARCFAETGVKQLCMLIQKEMARHQDQRMQFMLNGSWTNVDPRVWHNQYILTAKVGLGTGDTTRKVNQILQLMGVQEKALALGLCTAENLYNSASDLVEAVQMGQPQRYFTLPQTPPPPKPDPNMVLVQGQLQLQQAKDQGQQQLAALEAQLKDAQHQRDAAYERDTLLLKEQLMDARARDEFTQKMNWEQQKFYMQLAQQRTAAAEKAGVDANTEIAMNTAILRDAEGNTLHVPKDVVTAVHQNATDAAQQHADRQHQSQENMLDRAHEAQQNEADRQHQAEQAAQAAAQQAAQQNQQGTTE